MSSSRLHGVQGSAARARGAFVMILGVMLLVVSVVVGSGPAAAAGASDATTPSTTKSPTSTTKPNAPTSTKPGPKPTEATTTTRVSTTSTLVTTTTESAVGTDVAVSGVCHFDVDSSASSYTIVVTVVGDAGAGGSIDVNGTVAAFTVPDSGSTSVEFVGRSGPNAVSVIDDIAGPLHDGAIDLAPCDPPAVSGATVLGACRSTATGEVYEITASLTGEPGATGLIRLDGAIVDLYTISETGTYETTLTAHAGSNTVWVHDDVYGPVSEGVVDIADCGAGATFLAAAQVTDSVAVAVECTTEDDESTAVLIVEIGGEAGANGVVDVDGRAYTYIVGDSGVFRLTVPTRVGEIPIIVTDFNVGVVTDELATVESCTSVIVGGGDSADPTPATTIPASSTTVADTQESTSTTDVDVLGVQIDQPDLPFTGFFQKGLAVAGSVLVFIGGFVLLGGREESDPLEGLSRWQP